MKCLSKDTTTGEPCQKVVGRNGCHYHGNRHVQERLLLANRPRPVEPEQLQFRLTPDEVKALIHRGYMAEQAKRTNAEEICGCQG